MKSHVIIGYNEISFDTLELFLSYMLLSFYFIVLVLFNWYFGYNSVITLFIYLSLFTII